MEIYLVRHCESEAHEKHIWGGNFGLTQKGIEDSKKIEIQERPTKIYSSTLNRAIQTASIRFPSEEIITCPEFNEINFGYYENTEVPKDDFIREVRRRNPERLHEYTNGDNIMTRVEKMHKKIDEIKAKSRPEDVIYIFSHDAILRAYISYIENGNIIAMGDVHFPNGSVYKISERGKIDKAIDASKIRHIHGVAEYMYANADKRGLIADEMYLIGFLHDIGYLVSKYNHENIGAVMLEKLGVEQWFTDVIRWHGTTPDDYMKLNKCGESSIPETLKLLWEADLRVDPSGEDVGYEVRLKNLEKKYGPVSDQYIKAKATIDWLKQREKN